MGEFVKSLEGGYSPAKCRVLQCFDTEGVVRGESFLFVVSSNAGVTEAFKKECRIFYPGCVFRKLKNAGDALGIQGWVARASNCYRSGYGERRQPPLEIRATVEELLSKWKATGLSHDKVFFADFAHAMSVGTLKEYVADIKPWTMGAFCESELRGNGCIPA